MMKLDLISKHVTRLETRSLAKERVRNLSRDHYSDQSGARIVSSPPPTRARQAMATTESDLNLNLDMDLGGHEGYSYDAEGDVESGNNDLSVSHNLPNTDYALKVCLNNNSSDEIDCLQLILEHSDNKPKKIMRRDLISYNADLSHHVLKRGGANFEVKLLGEHEKHDREILQSADNFVIDNQPASQSGGPVHIINAGPKYIAHGTADETGEEEIFGSENDPEARERERVLLFDLAPVIDLAKDDHVTRGSDQTSLIHRILHARLLNNVSVMLTVQ